MLRLYMKRCRVLRRRPEQLVQQSRLFRKSSFESLTCFYVYTNCKIGTGFTSHRWKRFSHVRNFGSLHTPGVTSIGGV